MALQGSFLIARQFVYAQVADGDAEIAGRHVLEFVRFVEDHGAAIGKNSSAGRALGLVLDGQVGEEQVMVDDDNVALRSPAMHFRNETAIILATLLKKARFRAGVELRPQRARF